MMFMFLNSGCTNRQTTQLVSLYLWTCLIWTEANISTTVVKFTEASSLTYGAKMAVTDWNPLQANTCGFCVSRSPELACTVLGTPAKHV